MTDPRTPVRVGAGQASELTSPPGAAGPPFDLRAQASAAALADSGATASPSGGRAVND